MILNRYRIKFKTIHCIEGYYLLFQVEWNTFIGTEFPEYFMLLLQFSNDSLLTKSLFFYVEEKEKCLIHFYHMAWVSYDHNLNNNGKLLFSSVMLNIFIQNVENI